MQNTDDNAINPIMQMLAAVGLDDEAALPDAIIDSFSEARDRAMAFRALKEAGRLSPEMRDQEYLDLFDEYSSNPAFRRRVDEESERVRRARCKVRPRLTLAHSTSEPMRLDRAAMRALLTLVPATAAGKKERPAGVRPARDKAKAPKASLSRKPSPKGRGR